MLKCLFFFLSTLLVGWLVNCRSVCQIVIIFAKTPACSNAAFGWVFWAGSGVYLSPQASSLFCQVWS